MKDIIAIIIQAIVAIVLIGGIIGLYVLFFIAGGWLAVKVMGGIFLFVGLWAWSDYQLSKRDDYK